MLKTLFKTLLWLLLNLFGAVLSTTIVILFSAHYDSKRIVPLVGMLALSMFIGFSIQSWYGIFYGLFPPPNDSFFGKLYYLSAVLDIILLTLFLYGDNLIGFSR